MDKKILTVLSGHCNSLSTEETLHNDYYRGTMIKERYVVSHIFRNSMFFSLRFDMLLQEGFRYPFILIDCASKPKMSGFLQIDWEEKSATDTSPFTNYPGIINFDWDMGHRVGGLHCIFRAIKYAIDNDFDYLSYQEADVIIDGPWCETMVEELDRSGKSIAAFSWGMPRIGIGIPGIRVDFWLARVKYFRENIFGRITSLHKIPVVIRWDEYWFLRYFGENIFYADPFCCSDFSLPITIAWGPTFEEFCWFASRASSPPRFNAMKKCFPFPLVPSKER